MQEEEISSEINKFLENFGESVKEIEYDGWPMWWFFKNDFLKNYLPPIFPRQEEIILAIKNGEELNRLNRLKSRLRIFSFKKALHWNEKFKSWISRFNRRESQPADKGNVMFLAHTNAIIFKNPGEDFEVDRVESVIREVRKDPSLQDYISIIDPLSRNSGFRLLRYPNLVYNFIDPEIRKKAGVNSRRLNKKWNRFKGGVKFDSEIQRKIFEHFKPALNFYLSGENTYIIVLYYETYRKIIRERKIRLLSVYASSRPIIRFAIAAADREGIPSIHVLHGFSMGRVKADLPPSTHYIVPGEAFKKELIRLGAAKENIRVTGAVFLDSILEHTGEKEKEGKQKEVLFLTSPFVEFNYLGKDYYFDCIMKLLKEFKKLGEAHFLIKLHPSERYMDEYQSLIKELKCRNVDVIQSQSKGDLYTLINDCDLFISFGSTATIESMILDKPTINISIIKEENFLEFDPIAEDPDSGVRIKSLETTAEEIRKCLFDMETRERLKDARERFIRSYLYKVDGMAGKRVLDAIKDLIGGLQ